ncbi:MAG: hypothetical protein ACKOTZ_06670, partial [Chloroflexota bacterium]
PRPPAAPPRRAQTALPSAFAASRFRGLFPAEGGKRDASTSTSGPRIKASSDAYAWHRGLDLHLAPFTDHVRGAFFFRTTGAFDHTPRMQLAASIRIERPGAVPLVAWLTHPCIAESMYLPAGLIQEPVAAFTAIVIDGQEVAFLRRTVDDARETRSAQPVGAETPTHSGIPAVLREVRILPAAAGAVRPLPTADAIRAAIADGSRIAGRTRYRLDDATVTLDYPVTTANVANDRIAWQIDAGPVLLPGRDPGGSSLAVDRLTPGYLVANDPAWAEITTLGGDGRARPLRIAAQTVLVVLP